MSEPVILPMIPEPVWIKEAYQRGEITEDEAVALLIGSGDEPEDAPCPFAL